MSLQIPPDLDWLVKITAGQGWPKGDEDKMRALGREWKAFAGQLNGVTAEFEPVFKQVMDNISGQPAEQFGKFVTQMHQQLPSLSEAGNQLAALSSKTAQQLEYSKYMIIAQSALLAAEIAWCVANAPLTAGGTMGLIPGLIAASRLTVMQILRRLAMAVLFGVVSQFGLDVAVQTIMAIKAKLKGDDFSWNWQNTLGMVEMGAIGGAIGGGLHLGMNKLRPSGFGDSFPGMMINGGVTGVTVTGISNVMNKDDSSLGYGLTSGLAGAIGSGGGRRGHGGGLPKMGEIHVGNVDKIHFDGSDLSQDVPPPYEPDGGPSSDPPAAPPYKRGDYGGLPGLDGEPNLTPTGTGTSGDGRGNPLATNRNPTGDRGGTPVGQPETLSSNSRPSNATTPGVNREATPPQTEQNAPAPARTSMPTAQPHPQTHQDAPTPARLSMPTEQPNPQTHQGIPAEQGSHQPVERSHTQAYQDVQSGPPVVQHGPTPLETQHGVPQDRPSTNDVRNSTAPDKPAAAPPPTRATPQQPTPVPTRDSGDKTPPVTTTDTPRITTNRDAPGPLESPRFEQAPNEPATRSNEPQLPPTSHDGLAHERVLVGDHRPPEAIRGRPIDQVDLRLGAPDELVGQSGHYVPKLPSDKVLGKMRPEQRTEVEQRFRERKAESDKLAADVAKLNTEIEAVRLESAGPDRGTPDPAAERRSEYAAPPRPGGGRPMRPGGGRSLPTPGPSGGGDGGGGRPMPTPPGGGGGRPMPTPPGIGGGRPMPTPPVEGGGHPPAPVAADHTRAASEISNDESWRHSEKPTADWMEPKNPVHVDQWAQLRNTPAYENAKTHVVTDIPTPLTSSRVELTEAGPKITMEPSALPVSYDVRRMQVAPDKWLKVFTLKVRLDAPPGTDPVTVDAVQKAALRGVDRFYNQGNRLPSGDQLHVLVEFVDQADAHATVKLAAAGERAHSGSWPLDATDHTLAHELGHLLGFLDHYKNPNLTLQDKDHGAKLWGRDPATGDRRDTGHVVLNRAVSTEDSGLMTGGVYRRHAAITPRELWLLERGLDQSGAVVRDTRLKDLYGDHVPDLGPSVYERAAHNDRAALVRLAEEGHRGSMRVLTGMASGGDPNARQALVTLAAKGDVHAVDGLVRAGLQDPLEVLGNRRPIDVLGQLAFRTPRPHEVAEQLLRQLAHEGNASAIGILHHHAPPPNSGGRQLPPPPAGRGHRPLPPPPPAPHQPHYGAPQSHNSVVDTTNPGPGLLGDARVNHWIAANAPDVTVVRNAARTLLAWHGVAPELVDREITEATLTEGFSSALHNPEGQTIALGRQGLQLKVVAIKPLGGVEGPATRAEETRRHDDAADTREVTEVGTRTQNDLSAGLKVPTPVVTVSGRVLPNSTESRRTHRHVKSGSTEIKQLVTRTVDSYRVSYEVSRAGHDRTVEVALEMQLSAPKHADEGAAGPLRLDYPSRSEAATAEVRAQQYRDVEDVVNSIEHADLDTAGITKAITRDAWEFRDVDERKRFEQWLGGLGAKNAAQQLFGEDTVRESFAFKGPLFTTARKEVVIKLRPREPVGGGEAPQLMAKFLGRGDVAITHTQDSTTSDSVARSGTHGVGGGLSVGSDALAAIIGPKLSVDVSLGRSSVEASRDGEDYRVTQSDTYQGQADTHQLDFTYVVKVGDKTLLVPGAAQLIMAQQAVTPPDISRMNSPTGVGHTDVLDAVHARYTMDDATVQDLSSRILMGLDNVTRQEGGTIDLPSIKQRLVGFIRDNARDILDGSEGKPGDGRPLALGENNSAPYLFLRGHVLRDSGAYVGPDSHRRFEDTVASGHSRGSDRSRTTEARLSVTANAGVGPVDLSGTLGVSSQTGHEHKLSSAEQAEQTWSSTGDLHRYKYQFEIEALRGDSPDEASPLPLAESAHRDTVTVTVPERQGRRLGGSDEPPRPESEWDTPDPAKPRPENRAPSRYEVESMKPITGLRSASVTALTDALPAGRGVRDFAREAVDWVAAGSKAAALTDTQDGLTGGRAVSQWAAREARLARTTLATSGARDRLSLERHNEGGFIGAAGRDVLGELTLHTTLHNPRVVHMDPSHGFTDTHRRQTTQSSGDRSSRGVDGTFKAGMSVNVPNVIKTSLAINTKATAGLRHDTVDNADHKVEVDTTATYRARGYLIEYDAVHELTASAHNSKTGLFGGRHDAAAGGVTLVKEQPDAVRVWVDAADLRTIDLPVKEIAHLEADDRASYVDDHPELQHDPVLWDDAEPAPARPDVALPRDPLAGIGTFALDRAGALEDLLGGVRHGLDQWRESLEGKLVPGKAAEVERLTQEVMEELGSSLVGGFGFKVEDALKGGLLTLRQRTTGESGRSEVLVVVEASLGDGKYRDEVEDYSSTVTYASTSDHTTKKGNILSGSVAADTGASVTLPSTRVGPVDTALEHVAGLVTDQVHPAVSGEASWDRGAGQQRHELETVTVHQSGRAFRFSYELNARVRVFPWLRDGLTAQYVRDKFGSEGRRLQQSWESEWFTVPSAVRVTVGEDHHLSDGHAVASLNGETLQVNPSVRNQRARLDPDAAEFSDDAVFHVQPFRASKLHSLVDQFAVGPETPVGRARMLSAHRSHELRSAVSAGELVRNFRKALSPGGYRIELNGPTLKALKVELDLNRITLVRALDHTTLEREVTGADHSGRRSDFKGQAGLAFQEGPAALKREVVAEHERDAVTTERHAGDNTADSWFLVHANLWSRLTPEYPDGKTPEEWNLGRKSRPDGDVRIVVNRAGLRDLGFDLDRVDRWAADRDAGDPAPTVHVEAPPDAPADPGPESRPAPADHEPYGSSDELLRDLEDDSVGHPDAAEGSRLLGPDLFGLYEAPQPPPFMAGHDYHDITAGQSVSLMDMLDLAKGYTLTREHLDPRGDFLPDKAAWTVEHERADGATTSWAPGEHLRPLDRKTVTPLLVHAIWLGGPLRDAGTQATFRENFGGFGAQFHQAAVPVLWTDVPREQFDQALRTRPPADGSPDPLADVRDMAHWARANKVRLINVGEVFNSEHPMRLQEFYNAEAGKQVGPGYAAASDILRMEVMHRFGGMYSDGDNAILGLRDLHRVARSDEGYAIQKSMDKGYKAKFKEFSNSAFVMSKGHPFAQEYLDQLRENYGKSQDELMPKADADFLDSPRGFVRRNSVMYRTGPEVIRSLAKRVGHADHTYLPGLRDVLMNSDASWLRPPPEGAPPLPHDRRSTLELTKKVVQTLVRGMHNRGGDLHLTAVEPAVRRHPNPDLVWHAALSYLTSHPDLSRQITTVTDQRTVGGVHHDVALPESVRSLLDISSTGERYDRGDTRRAVTVVAEVQPAADRRGPLPYDPDAHDHDRRVVDDESWRHSRERTAPWFEPKRPFRPDQWEHLRRDDLVRTVHTEIADVKTSSWIGKDHRPHFGQYTGLVRYDMRRIEVEPGRLVREHTVKLHLSGDPEQVAKAKRDAVEAVDSLLNKGYRLPSGEQFHVRLEFPDSEMGSHATVKVGGEPTDQTHWRVGENPKALAHEVLHYLGPGDEYRDRSRVFLDKPRKSAVVADDGLLGARVRRADVELKPRNLWYVERVARDQVEVPETRLGQDYDGLKLGQVNPRAEQAVAGSTRPMDVDSDRDAEGDPDPEYDGSDRDADADGDLDPEYDASSQPGPRATLIPLHEIDRARPDAPVNQVSGTVGYDVRRMEVMPDKWVQEATLRLYMYDEDGVLTPGDLNRRADDLQRGVDARFNQGYLLPGGDQFRLNVVRVGDQADAHAAVPMTEDVEQPHELANWVGDYLLDLSDHRGMTVDHLSKLADRHGPLHAAPYDRDRDARHVWQFGDDVLDRQRWFHAGEVMSTPLVDHQGRRFGVTFVQTRQEQRNDARWASGEQRERSMLYRPDVGSARLVNQVMDGVVERERLDVPTPWTGDEAAVVAVHSDGDRAALHVLGLGEVRVDGRTLAHVATRTAGFLEGIAGGRRTTTLLACSAGAGAAARDVHEVLAQLGQADRVFAPTDRLIAFHPMSTVRDGHTSVTTIQGGGHWNVFGEPTPEQGTAIAHELADAARQNWTYGDHEVDGEPVPLASRNRTLNLVRHIIGEVEQGGPGVDAPSTISRLARRHERPEIVSAAVRRYFDSQPKRSREDSQSDGDEGPSVKRPRDGRGAQRHEPAPAPAGDRADVGEHPVPGRDPSFSSPADWARMRDDAHVEHVDTERFDPSVRADVHGHGGILDGWKTRIAYESRRMEIAEDTWVREYTVRLRTEAEPGVSPHELQRVRDRVVASIDDHLNGRYRFANGDQFHLRVEFDGDGPRHGRVTVHNGKGSNQARWSTGDPDAVLVHEVLHNLGLKDEAQNDKAVFRKNVKNADVRGVMGSEAWSKPPSLTEAHLRQILDVGAASGVRHEWPAVGRVSPEAVRRDVEDPWTTPDRELTSVEHRPAPAEHGQALYRLVDGAHRTEVEPGRWVREATLHVAMRDGDGEALPEVISWASFETLRRGVDERFTGFRLPDGDELRLTVVHAADPSQAHTTIRLGPHGDQPHQFAEHVGTLLGLDRVDAERDRAVVDELHHMLAHEPFRDDVVVDPEHDHVPLSDRVGTVSLLRQMIEASDDGERVYGLANAHERPELLLTAAAEHLTLPGERGAVIPVDEIDRARVDAPVNHVRGPISYDVRSMEVRPDEWVQEVTLRLYLRDGHGVLSGRELRGSFHHLLQGVENRFNQGYLLPGGDQFRLNVVHVEDEAQAHAVFPIAGGEQPHELADQVGDMLGLSAHEHLTGHHLAELRSRHGALREAPYDAERDNRYSWQYGGDALDRYRWFHAGEVMSMPLVDHQGRRFGTTFVQTRREQELDAGWAADEHRQRSVLLGPGTDGDRMVEQFLRGEPDRERLDVPTPWTGDEAAVVAVHSGGPSAFLHVIEVGEVYVDGRTLAHIAVRAEGFREGVADGRRTTTLLACRAGAGDLGRDLYAALRESDVADRMFAPTGAVRNAPRALIRDGHDAVTIIEDGGHWNVYGETTPEHDDAIAHELASAVHQGWPYDGNDAGDGTLVPLSDRNATVDLVGGIVDAVRRRGEELDESSTRAFITGLAAAHERPDIVSAAVRQYFESHADDGVDVNDFAIVHDAAPVEHVPIADPTRRNRDEATPLSLTTADSAAAGRRLAALLGDDRSVTAQDVKITQRSGGRDVGEAAGPAREARRRVVLDFHLPEPAAVGDALASVLTAHGAPAETVDIVLSMVNETVENTRVAEGPEAAGRLATAVPMALRLLESTGVVGRYVREAGDAVTAGLMVNHVVDAVARAWVNEGAAAATALAATYGTKGRARDV